MPRYYSPETEDNVPFTYTMPTWFIGTLPPPYPAVDDPDMYLKFAMEDRKSGGDVRGLVNAIGNIKKALHLRIDMLLHQFGLFKHYGEKKFTAKLKLIEDLDILPTTMMRKINAQRTFVEHEYTVPAKEEIDEALDVIRLLYLASEEVLERLMSEAVVGLSRHPAHALLRVEPMHGELRFFEIEPMPDVTTLGNGIEVVSFYPRPLLKEKPEYTTVDSPFKVLTLDSGHKDEWLPIIKWIVALSVEEFRSGRLTRVGDYDYGLVTTTVTYPLSVVQERGLTEAATKALDQRSEREKEQREGEEQGATTLGPSES